MASRKRGPDQKLMAAPMPGLGRTVRQRRMAGMSFPTRTTVPRRQKQTTAQTPRAVQKRMAGQKRMAAQTLTAGQTLMADLTPRAWPRTRTPMAAHSIQKQTVQLPFQRRTVQLSIQTPMADRMLMG